MSDIAALFTWVNIRFLLQGLGMTLLISALAILCSVVLGTVISVMRTSNSRVLRGVATVYIEIFKNTPLLLWIMFTFFVAQLPPIGAAVLAFTLFTSASVAEIVRGGIMSIDPGQMEAGRSLGFNYAQTMIYIILPQTFKSVLPALANEFIVLLKETSVSAYIGLNDLTRGGDIIRGVTYSDFMPLIAVALVYLVIVVVLSACVNQLERRLRKSDRG